MNRDKIRVLLVEDDWGDYLLTRTFLSQVEGSEFALEWQKRYDTALQRMTASEHDVYLLDYSLGERTGLDLLRDAVRGGCTAPVIFLTGARTPALDRAAMNAGAVDYLVKGQIDASLLERSIRYSIERKRVEERLRQARNAALAAAQSKAELLAMMSREIQPPLNGIARTTHHLLGTRLSTTQRRCLETVRTSCDHLTSITREMLNFERIETDGVELHRKAFEIRVLLDGLIRSFRPQAAKKGIGLSYTVDDATTRWIVGDATRLNQVLTNLVGNSLKFTHHGEVAVSVSLRPPGPSGKVELLFQVRDTGIGIPAARLDRLFEAFSQADASITRKYGGTGLGLAISKKLVELMGGKIWVESRERVGSSFYFAIEASLATASEPIQRDRVQPTLEPAILRRLSARTSHGLVTELIDIFHQETPPRLRQLRAALDHSDTETLGKIAHWLKGHLMNIGATRMSWLCGLLEQHPICPPPGAPSICPPPGEILGDIEREHELVNVALKEYQAERGED